MKKIHILALSIAIALFGCKNNEHKNNPENTVKKEDVKEVVKTVDSHTSEISLDWNGTYHSFFPCASCPGILTTVKLNNDKTFEKSDLYLGTENGYFDSKGTFSFTKDGGKIILKSEKASENQTTLYAVGENKLTLLDSEGKKTASEFAEMYVYKKASNTPIDFSNKVIKGFLTFGHEVSSFRPCDAENSYWITDPSNKLRALYYKEIGNQKTPYTPVMAELTVKNIGKATEGFAEQYESVLETVAIKSVAAITPENYCK
ncbi:copper resistance protein NlpE [Tenacibaculum finnmarkense]|uniref:copper resistance protein NlpE n=1 Tax=Tenacibaculum finnmarkense TaxID=2781243 RepID=UPI001E5E8A15|nr:copper resistance protein NlpE [Tenacibaculum finnmarkense]MCD8447229.1 copper resistance protein NlpE N-terminal domain-containing protein [Tenacibaculum finnmarkense genomovar finnmarkense]